MTLSSYRFNIEPILEWFGAVIPPHSSKLQCPFHDDGHASGYIPDTRQYFKCLACGVQGDAVRLLYDFRLEDGEPVGGGLAGGGVSTSAEDLPATPAEPVPGTAVSSGRVPGRQRN